MATWVPEPSFSRSIARAARDRQFPVARVMLSKTGIRRLLEAVEAPMPGEFRQLGPLVDITAETLARPTVIKPIQGSNNRGVLPLVPLGQGRWRDLEHRSDLTLRRIHEKLAHAVIEHSLPDSWIGEELLRGPDGGPIDDIKFLMFRGRVGAIFLRKNPAHTFSWFDETWQPLFSGLQVHSAEAGAPPPVHRDELTALAVRISRALPIPFVRVDMYDTENGPVVGEVTPYPGWAHELGDDLDVRLGVLYELAETELLAEGMDWARVADGAQIPELIREFIGTRGSK